MVTDENLRKAAQVLRDLAIRYSDRDYAVSLLHLSNEMEWQRLILAWEKTQTSL